MRDTDFKFLIFFFLFLFIINGIEKDHNFCLHFSLSID